MYYIYVLIAVYNSDGREIYCQIYRKRHVGSLFLIIQKPQKPGKIPKLKFLLCTRAFKWCTICEPIAINQASCFGTSTRHKKYIQESWETEYMILFHYQRSIVCKYKIAIASIIIIMQSPKYFFSFLFPSKHYLSFVLKQFIPIFKLFSKIAFFLMLWVITHV